MDEGLSPSALFVVSVTLGSFLSLTELWLSCL